MTPDALWTLKVRVRRWWVLSPERLWLTSIALCDRDHWVLAFWLKQLNSFLYHNSLAPGASVSPDIHLGHNSLGIVINRNVQIGRGVTIWHNVTLAAGRPEKRPARETGRRGGDQATRGRADRERGPRAQIIIADHVKIGANAVVIAPRARTLRIGMGARIGAGAVVTHDVPAGATVIAPAMRVLPKGSLEEAADAERSEIEQLD
jgi:serine O-acetyltransferase